MNVGFNLAIGSEFGDVSPMVIGRLMFEAYKPIMNPPTSIDWDYTER